MNEDNGKGYGCFVMLVSGVALLISLIALLKWDSPLNGLSGESWVIAALSALITFVVAWQIWTTMASKEEIKKAMEASERLKDLEKRLEEQSNLFNQHNLEIKNLIDAHAKISEAEKIKDLHIKYTTYAEALDLLLQSNVGLSYEQFDNILYGLNGIIGKLSDIKKLSSEEVWNILESENDFEWHYKQIISRLEKRSDEIAEFKRKLNLIKELREGAISDIKQSEKGKAIIQKKRETAESWKSSK